MIITFRNNFFKFSIGDCTSKTLLKLILVVAIITTIIIFNYYYPSVIDREKGLSDYDAHLIFTFINKVKILR